MAEGWRPLEFGVRAWPWAFSRAAKLEEGGMPSPQQMQPLDCCGVIRRRPCHFAHNSDAQ